MRLCGTFIQNLYDFHFSGPGVLTYVFGCIFVRCGGISTLVLWSFLSILLYFKWKFRYLPELSQRYKTGLFVRSESMTPQTLFISTSVWGVAFFCLTSALKMTVFVSADVSQRFSHFLFMHVSFLFVQNFACANTFTFLLHSFFVKPNSCTSCCFLGHFQWLRNS